MRLPRILSGILSLFILPHISFAFVPGSTPSTNRPYTSPCKHLAGQDQYRCRRFEAVSQARSVSNEHNQKLREVRPSYVNMAQVTSDKRRAYFLSTKKLTSTEINIFLRELSVQRSQEYSKWIEEYIRITKARRNLRELTREFSNTDLRVELIGQKAERLNADYSKLNPREVRRRQREYIEQFIQE